MLTLVLCRSKQYSKLSVEQIETQVVDLETGRLQGSIEKHLNSGRPPFYACFFYFSPVCNGKRWENLFEL